jgi:hypothetical protein
VAGAVVEFADGFGGLLAEVQHAGIDRMRLLVECHGAHSSPVAAAGTLPRSRFLSR